MLYPKRRIEVDLPIRRISAHAQREKSARKSHGHISALHIWWAQRPAGRLPRSDLRRALAESGRVHFWTSFARTGTSTCLGTVH